MLRLILITVSSFGIALFWISPLILENWIETITEIIPIGYILLYGFIMAGMFGTSVIGMDERKSPKPPTIVLAKVKSPSKYLGKNDISFEEQLDLEERAPVVTSQQPQFRYPDLSDS